MNIALLVILTAIFGIIIYNCSQKESYSEHYTPEEQPTTVQLRLTQPEEAALEKMGQYFAASVGCIIICSLLLCSCSIFFIYKGATANSSQAI